MSTFCPKWIGKVCYWVVCCHQQALQCKTKIFLRQISIDWIWHPYRGYRNWQKYLLKVLAVILLCAGIAMQKSARKYSRACLHSPRPKSKSSPTICWSLAYVTPLISCICNLTPRAVRRYTYQFYPSPKVTEKVHLKRSSVDPCLGISTHPYFETRVIFVNLLSFKPFRTTENSAIQNSP